MKKYARFVSYVLIFVMSLFAFACTPIEDNDIKNETTEPNHIDLDKLKPLESGSGSIIRLEENKYSVYYGGYNEKLAHEELVIIEDFDEFKQFNVNDWLSQYAAASDAAKNPVEFATEEYFETHYLVAFRMVLTSGSQKVKLENIKYDSGKVKIYLSCDIDGDVGTSDMASASVLIGIKKAEGITDTVLEIYVNDVIFDFDKDNGGIK